MDCCSPEKQKLIEEVGLHFEKSKQLAPLAARIYAIMVLSPSDGHTFEEIMTITDASKSSVSTQLNLLMQTKKVEYFTKPGERKRYFRTSKTYLKNTLKDYHDDISEELIILDKIIDYKSSKDHDKFKHNGQIPTLLMEYLSAQKENLERIIQRVSEIENN